VSTCRQILDNKMSGYFLPILRLVLLLLIHINMLATASADNESQPGKPSVFSDFNAGSITGLDFPGSAGVKATMRFKFTNPHNNGLPIYRVGGRGVTYIGRAFHDNKTVTIRHFSGAMTMGRTT
jgi:hypothetical protein